VPQGNGAHRRELRAEHAKGLHDEKRFPLCPVCVDLDNEEFAQGMGYDSYEAYADDAWRIAQTPSVETQKMIERHELGEHRKGRHAQYASRGCPHQRCVERTR
jgi:hypothetical protein